MLAVELGELELAPRRLALGLVGRRLGPGLGSFREGGRTDPVGLEAVDPRQQPGQQPGGVAANLMPP